MGHCDLICYAKSAVTATKMNLLNWNLNTETAMPNTELIQGEARTVSTRESVRFK
jgi:hypothetical protein